MDGGAKAVLTNLEKINPTALWDAVTCGYVVTACQIAAKSRNHIVTTCDLYVVTDRRCNRITPPCGYDPVTGFSQSNSGCNRMCRMCHMPIYIPTIIWQEGKP